MKHVLYITNYPSPYRVNFFDELSRYCDVTVLLSERVKEQKHWNPAWFIQGEGSFHLVELGGLRLKLGEETLCGEVISWLKKPFDVIIVGGYSSPTAILALGWLKWKRIPFYMEVDGGLIREDSRLKYLFKKSLVSSAAFWLSSGEATDRYLTHYGAKPDRISHYPFTSLYARDILPELPSEEEKRELRKQLGMEEEKILLCACRIDPGKGLDVLLQAAGELADNVGVYIVGGEPDEQLRQILNARALPHVHFVSFCSKEALKRYYRAADLFVLPTRSDVWGLVINEAMACGLGIITTERCVAGLELVENGVNGYLVPVDDAAELAEKLNTALRGDLRAMGRASLEKIRPYTIENMAKIHGEILGL